MADRLKDDGNKKAAVADHEDRIGALPDALLQHVLSLLPSRDAVRTCVLATRWRTLWKSVPSLRINAAGERYHGAHALSKFVNYLLLLRDRAPLHECEINCHGGDRDEAFRYIELWLRYALSCEVRVLRVQGINHRNNLRLSNVPLLTQHLTRLELSTIEVGGCFLDFSSCPALEVLKMKYCDINAERISSQLLRHLIIHGGVFMSYDRTRISAPSLITLVLAEFTGYTPMLEPMPSLVRAFLRFEGYCNDRCEYDNYFGDCGSESCDGCSYSKNDDCVLLEGLSGTTNLELISPSELEESATETEKCYNPRARFLVSKHLKVVEIKCHKEDETVHQIVKILGTHGVSPEHINIEQNFYNYDLGRFSFEQEKLNLVP